MTPKEKQKQHLIDLMRMDEEAGLYKEDPPKWLYKPDIDKWKELKELHLRAKLIAGASWEGCDGCDEHDKNFWIQGFVHGYIKAKQEIEKL